MHDLRPHPLAAIVPPMQEDEYNDLVETMREVGFLKEYPVYLYEGQILDGIHRYKASLEAGVEAVYEEYTGNDPIRFVIAVNLHRRHLTAGQRATTALSLWSVQQTLWEIEPGSQNGQHGDKKPRSTAKTTKKDVAEDQHTTTTYMQRAKQIKEFDEAHGTTLFDTVNSGSQTLHGVHTLIEEADPKRDSDLIERVSTGLSKAHTQAKIAKQRTEVPHKRKHPATYSEGMMFEAVKWLTKADKVLDPFAGAGGIYDLLGWLPDIEIEAIDIEANDGWTDMDKRVKHGNASSLRWDDAYFDAVVTSPTYGNGMNEGRLAYDAVGRDDYASRLGRELSPSNTGSFRWTNETYRELHEQAWQECKRVLKPGGKLLMFIRDHLSQQKPQPVTGWHVNALLSIGFDLVTVWAIATPGLRRGQGTENAAGTGEVMVVMQKPT